MSTEQAINQLLSLEEEWGGWTLCSFQ